MQKIFTSLLLLSIMFNSSAQKIDTLNLRQDSELLSVRNIKRAGIAISVTGFTLFSIGLVRFATSPTECDPTSPTGNQRCHFTEIHGKGFLLAGAITMGIGIPVWTFSKQKEVYGRVRLFPMTSSSPVSSVGLVITF